jgi:hypothetical protein
MLANSLKSDLNRALMLIDAVLKAHPGSVRPATGESSIPDNIGRCHEWHLDLQQVPSPK